jgi:hypothetical protein
VTNDIFSHVPETCHVTLAACPHSSFTCCTLRIYMRGHHSTCKRTAEDGTACCFLGRHGSNFTAEFGTQRSVSSSVRHVCPLSGSVCSCSQCLSAPFADRMGRDWAAQADIPIGKHEFKFVVNDKWVTSNVVPFSEDHFLVTKETSTAEYSSTLSEPCCTLNDISLCDSLLLPDHQCVAAEIETSAAHIIKHKSTKLITTHTQSINLFCRT